MCEIKGSGGSSGGHEGQSSSDIIPWLIHGHPFVTSMLASLYMHLCLFPLDTRIPVL